MSSIDWNAALSDREDDRQLKAQLDKTRAALYAAVTESIIQVSDFRLRVAELGQGIADGTITANDAIAELDGLTRGRET